MSKTVRLTQSRITEYAGHTSRRETTQKKPNNFYWGNCRRRKFEKFSKTGTLRHFDRDRVNKGARGSAVG